jgi:hypothetical protein
VTSTDLPLNSGFTNDQPRVQPNTLSAGGMLSHNFRRAP